MSQSSFRIGVLADIHGNDLALEAVLADIDAAGGVSEYWILGDLAAIGPEPVKVVQRLAQLPNAHFIRGNTDRYVCTGELPGPSIETIATNPALVIKSMEIAASFSWTKGALIVTKWLDWLCGMPLEYRAILPDGTRALCVHASPGTDAGDGIMAKDTPDEIKPLLAGCEDDLILVGHTHQPFDLQVGGKRIVNPGSISNPFGPDVRASYALIEADGNGVRVEHRKAAYDVEAVIAAVERIGHPAARMIIKHLRGES